MAYLQPEGSSFTYQQGSPLNPSGPKSWLRFLKIKLKLNFHWLQLQTVQVEGQQQKLELMGAQRLDLWSVDVCCGFFKDIFMKSFFLQGVWLVHP